MASTYHADIQALYVAYFNRPADYLGLNFWETAIENAVAAAGSDTAAQAAAKASILGQISAGFAASDEYLDVYGDLATEQVIGTVYQNLFGHAPDLEGLVFWVNAVRGGHMTVADAVTTIAAGAQGTDKEAFENKTAAAVAFTNELDTGEEVLGYAGEEALAAAKLFIASITTDASLASAIAPAALSATVAGVIDAGTPTPEVKVFTLTSGVDTGAAFTGGAGDDQFIGNTTTLSALDSLNGGTGVDTLTLYGVDADGVASALNLSLPTAVANIENLDVISTASALAMDSADVSDWTGLTSASFAVKAANVQSVTVADTTAVTVTNSAGGVSVTGGSTVTITASADAAAAAVVTAYAAAQAAAKAANTDTTDDATAGQLAAIKAAFGTAAGVSAADKATVDATATDADALAAIATIVTAKQTAASTSANAAVTIAGDAVTTATVAGGSTVSVSDNGEGTLTSVSLKGNTGAATLEGDALTSVSLASTKANATITNATIGHSLTLGVNAVGSSTAAITVADALAASVNLNVTGSKSTTVSNVNLDANVATALTIDTAAALTLTTTALAADDKLAAVVVKGAGSVTADLSGISSLKSVDMSAGSGKHTVNVAGATAALAVKGGSGVDAVTVTGALDAKATVSLGAGNDTYTFTTAAVAGAVVAGGDGTDTLAVADGSLVNADAAKVYSGFETLEIAGGTGSYDMSVLGLTAVTLTGAALTGGATIANAAAGTTVGITSKAKADLVTGQTLTYALKDATGTADAVTLSLTAIDGDNDGDADGEVTATGFTAAGIETVTVVSAASTVDADNADTVLTDEALTAADYVNTIGTLAIANAKTLVLKGAASTTITTLNGAALTKIDASAATGDVNVSAAALGGTTAITFLGGAGDDTYTVSGKGDIIAGNAGADSITLGAGKDTVAYSKASDSILTLVDITDPADGDADVAVGFDVITNFATGSDILDLSSLNLATGATRGSITLQTATADTAVALQDLIGDGAAFFNDGVANRGLSLVTAGGNSYLFIDTNGDGNYTAGVDSVIKLAGVTTIVLNDIAFG